MLQLTLFFFQNSLEMPPKMYHFKLSTVLIIINAQYFLLQISYFVFKIQYLTLQTCYNNFFFFNYCFCSMILA